MRTRARARPVSHLARRCQSSRSGCLGLGTGPGGVPRRIRKFPTRARAAALSTARPAATPGGRSGQGGAASRSGYARLAVRARSYRQEARLHPDLNWIIDAESVSVQHTFLNTTPNRIERPRDIHHSPRLHRAKYAPREILSMHPDADARQGTRRSTPHLARCRWDQRAESTRLMRWRRSREARRRSD